MQSFLPVLSNITTKYTMPEGEPDQTELRLRRGGLGDLPKIGGGHRDLNWGIKVLWIFAEPTLSDFTSETLLRQTGNQS
jgi:hypothetical protein